MKRIRLALATFMILTGLVGVGQRPASAAPCTKEVFATSGTFTYRLCTMPDIDQRRTEAQGIVGLAGAGSMYCAPTAIMNTLAYIANHGYPALAPGPGDWQQGPPNHTGVYNTMTLALAILGGQMGTDPATGTGGNGAESGTESWIAADGLSDAFTVSHYYASGYFSPTLKNIADSALSGDLVEPVVGWYKHADEQGVEKTRKGGHVFTLMHAGGSRLDFHVHTMGFRDPANPNDGQTTSQSTFATDTRDIEERYAKFDGYNRVQSRVVGYGSAYLDEYFAIRPEFGLVGSEDQPILLYLTPVLHILDSFEGGNVHPAITSFQTATDTKVLDLAVHPEGAVHPYLTQDSNAVWQLDTLTGRSSRLARFGNPPTHLAFGKDEELFVLLPNAIAGLGLDGTEIGRARLTKALDDIAYQKLESRGSPVGRLLGVSARARRLLAYDDDLVPILDLPIPASVQNLAGKVSMALDPNDGTIWLHTDGSPTVSRLRFNDAGRLDAKEIALEGVGRPIGLEVSDEGHLFLSDGGKLKEFDTRGRALGNGVFAGMPGGPTVSMVHSYTNFDPTVHTGLAWNNVLPEDAVQP
jgi:hypothetical protein